MPISNIIGSWKAPNWAKFNLGGGPKIKNNTPKGSDTYSSQMIIHRINNFFRKYGDAVAVGMCLRFSVRAAKYTPPKNRGKWTGTIQDSLYFRPIQDLRLLAKGYYPRNHASKKDYQMLREGYLFRIMNTKYRHRRTDAVFAYAKGINEAKRLSRIQNRGLSKYSWGELFDGMTKEALNQLQVGKGDIGQAGQSTGVSVYKVTKLPPIFQRLAKKSPNITKYHWGSYKWKYNPSKQQPKTIDFTITNRLTQIERYGQIAIKQGLIAAKKYAQKVWKSLGPIAGYRGFDSSEVGNVSQERQVVEGLRNLLAKMFDDDVKKYGIKQLNLEKEYKGQSLMTNHIMNDIHISMRGD